MPKPEPKRQPNPQYEQYSQLLKKHDPEQTWNGMVVYAMNPETGEVLVNRGGNQQHDSASLNKLMIFHMVMDEVEAGKLDLKKEFTIPRIYITDGITRVESDPKVAKTKKASNRIPTNLVPESTFSLHTLLGTLMIASDNGAANFLGSKLEEIYKQPAKKEEKNKPLWETEELREGLVVPQDKTASATPKQYVPEILNMPNLTPEVIEALTHHIKPGRTKTAVSQMNMKAKKLGMTRTTYANESGLPTNWINETTNPENMTTAKDMTLLLRSISKQYERIMSDEKRSDAEKEEVKQLFESLQASSITYCGHTENAHQKLGKKGAVSYLGDQYAIWGKTGYTKRAGHNIAASIEDQHGHEVLIVALGGRWSDAATLKGMNIGIKPLQKGGQVRGDAVRDVLVKKIAIDLIQQEQEKEQKNGKKSHHPHTEKTQLGMNWHPATPIQYEGETTEIHVPNLNNLVRQETFRTATAK